MRLVWCFGLFLVLAACGAAQPHAYSSLELAHASSSNQGEALVHYLAVRHADPEVCDRSRPKPVLLTVHPATIEALVDSLVQGHARPQALGECLMIGLSSWDEQSQLRTVGSLGRAYLALLREKRAPMPQRDILRRLLLRTESARWESLALDEVAKDLAQTLSSGELAAAQRAFAQEWWDALELAHDRHAGQPLTAEQVRALPDATLTLAAAHLAARELRHAAKRELLTRRIRRSPYAIVRDDEAGVIEAMLRTGHNQLSIAQRPLSKLWFAADTAPDRVVARQDLTLGTALLSVYAADRELGSHWPLARWLWFTFDGVTPPVTLCGRPSALDPTPCVRRRDVAISGTGLRSDDAGVLHWSDALPLPELLQELGATPALGVRVQLAEHAISHALALQVEAPPPLIAAGSEPGAPGAKLAVRVHEQAGLAVFHVASETQRWLAIVDPQMPGHFAIVSRGADGAAGMSGSSGSDGSAGLDGSSATCMTQATAGGRGGDGGRGRDGSPGAAGGAGGEVHVRISCGSGDCAALQSLVRSIVRSEGGKGGAGGSGGSGGRGGRGGRGGSGTSCTVQRLGSPDSTEARPGGTDGFSGSDGSRGSDGAHGPAGAPGRVELELEVR
ncbi:MAG: hypothetical protein ABW321_32405 [Polyangiales bacterium]